jgi:hypothetical protein
MTTHITCTDIVDFTFHWGRWFIIAALVAAAAMAAVEAYAKYAAAKAAQGRSDFDAGTATAFLGALKDLLIALGNLPAWFAIFLAGGALIWFARDTLSLCH